MSNLPNCKYCGRKLTKEILSAKKQAKINNAANSRAKALARGHKLGAKRKFNDVDKVRILRAEGFSIRKIAVETGASTSSIQRILKEIKHLQLVVS